MTTKYYNTNNNLMYEFHFIFIINSKGFFSNIGFVHLLLIWNASVYLKGHFQIFRTQLF